MDAPSRLERARRQLRVARYSLGAAAVAGFALFGVAARAAHPGTSTPAPTASTATASDDDQQSTSTFDFGDGSIGPSNSAPSIQSGGS
jgi:hypothetical protein